MRRRDFIILVSGGVGAGAMGLTIPATILATAEEVIE